MTTSNIKVTQKMKDKCLLSAEKSIRKHKKNKWKIAE